MSESALGVMLEVIEVLEAVAVVAAQEAIQEVEEERKIYFGISNRCSIGGRSRSSSRIRIRSR